MIRRLFPLLCFVALLSFPSFAGESGLADPAKNARGRIPAVGEWMDYVLGHPLDPLEHSLGVNADAMANPDAPVPDVGEEGMFFIRPSFEPAPVWRSMPLRVEITKREALGCQMRLTFGGVTHSLFLPLAGEEAEAEFHYDDEPPDERRSHFVGDVEFPVTEVRRTAGLTGFVRWENPDLPFGIARFASPDVDLVLVAMGRGEPPAVPPPAPDRLEPPIGELFVEGE